MVFVLVMGYKVTCFLNQRGHKVNTKEIRIEVFILFGLIKLLIKSDRGEVNLFPVI